MRRKNNDAGACWWSCAYRFKSQLCFIGFNSRWLLGMIPKNKIYFWLSQMAQHLPGHGWPPFNVMIIIKSIASYDDAASTFFENLN